MKKLWITLIILAVGATTTLFAQEKSSFNVMQERFSYMKGHLALNEKEGDVFWKSYSQYLKDEMAIMDAYRKNLEKQGIKLGAPGTNKETIEKLNDKQLTYLQDQKFEMRKKLLDLEISYYKKFKTMLPPKTLQKYYNLEYKYKRSLTSKKKGDKKEVPAEISGNKKKR